LEEVHAEELQNLYSSPSAAGMIKLRRVGWAGYVTRLEKRIHADFRQESLKEEDYSEDLALECRLRIGTDLRDAGLGMCTGFIWLRIETSARLLCIL
jgi:hypothetical protein